MFYSTVFISYLPFIRVVYVVVPLNTAYEDQKHCSLLKSFFLWILFFLFSAYCRGEQQQMWWKAQLQPLTPQRKWQNGRVQIFTNYPHMKRQSALMRTPWLCFSDELQIEIMCKCNCKCIPVMSVCDIKMSYLSFTSLHINK